MWWIFLLLLIVFAILLVIYVKKTRQAHEQRIPVENLAELTIEQARVNDSLIIIGAGDDYEDLHMTVARRHRYESGGDRWYELQGDYRGRLISLEVYRDDALHVTLYHYRDKLRLDDLGLTEDDLVRMDENQDTGEAITYDGSTFHFAGSGEAGFFADERGEGEGYYGWEFNETDGSRTIFVEKWEGEPFEAGIGVRINPHDIQVLRA